MAKGCYSNLFTTWSVTMDNCCGCYGDSERTCGM